MIDRRTFLAAGAVTLSLPSCATRRAAPLPATLAWQKLPTTAFRGKQDDIAFGTPQAGWFGNGEGRLYRTGNGGDSWEQVWHKPGTYIRALGFLDERHGVLGNVGAGVYPPGTDTIPLYHTADGGSSWAPSLIQGPAPAGICGIEIQRARGRTIVHATGRVNGPGHYLRSQDGGRTFRSQELGTLANATYDVKFLNARTGFIAASHGIGGDMRGTILRTEDGGDTWREVFRSTRGFETVWKLHFPTPRIGYGTIQNYDPDKGRTQRHLTKTVDGGRTWSELPLIDSHPWRSFAVGFADENVGWIGGTTGGLETRDGGLSWRPIEFGRAVNKIRFVGSGAGRHAYAIGSEVHRLDL
jgi:photosystem II stability/assembly factor-like uncharacterized protein